MLRNHRMSAVDCSAPPKVFTLRGWLTLQGSSTSDLLPIHSYNSQAKNKCSLKFSILSSQKTDGQTWFFIENSSDGNFIDVHNVARGHSVKNMSV